MDSMATLALAKLDGGSLEVEDDEVDPPVMVPASLRISNKNRTTLFNRLRETMYEIASAETERCLEAVRELYYWIMAAHERWLENPEEIPKTDIQPTIPDEPVARVEGLPSSATTEWLDVEAIALPPVKEKSKPVVNPRVATVILRKYLEGRNVADKSLGFRTIGWFKATTIYKHLITNKNPRCTANTYMMYTNGMERTIHSHVISIFIDCAQAEDWGACVTQLFEYELLLRQILIDAGHGSLVSANAIGVKSSVHFAAETSTKRAAPTKREPVQERVALEIEVPEILSIDQLVEIADELTEDDQAFLNTFVGLLDDRAKNVMKDLENERRRNEVYLHNQTRYKHNVVLSAKRRYCRRYQAMRIATRRYDYVLEHYKSLTQYSNNAAYVEKKHDIDMAELKLQSYDILRASRDSFTLRNIEDVEIRKAYEDFYKRVIYPHVDALRELYNEEAWTITLATDELVSALGLYVSITHMLRKIERGKARGCYIDNRDAIKIKGCRAKKYCTVDSLREDFTTLANREAATLSARYSATPPLELLREVITKIYAISTSRQTTKEELRSLGTMLESALERLE